MKDLISKLGYAYNSPFRANPYLDITTEEGIITMENTPVDLLGIDNLGNTQIMKAFDKNPYKFKGNLVREIPMGNIYQKGGMTSADLFNFIFDDEEVDVTDPLPKQPEPEVIAEQEVRRVQNEEDQAMIDEILYSNRVSGNPYRRGRSTGSSPSDREMYTFNFFINKGYTPEQAAGITANIKYESNFDISASGDKGKAKGLAQWHPDRYSHLSSIFDMGSYDGHLEAIDYELNTKEKTAKSKLVSTQKPEDAAFVFDKYFERSAGLSTRERMNYAKNLYNNYYGRSR